MVKKQVCMRCGQVVTPYCACPTCWGPVFKANVAMPIQAAEDTIRCANTSESKQTAQARYVAKTQTCMRCGDISTPYCACPTCWGPVSQPTVIATPFMQEDL